jgi:hypothetical protein
MVRVGNGGLLRGLLLSCGLVFAGSACVGKSCTLIGCSNSANIDIGRDGAWQDGAYTLELSLDGEGRRCSFIVPDDLPPYGRGAGLDCGEGVDATIWQRSTCSSTVSRDGNSGSGACTPIPNEYEIALELSGNPKTIAITLARDGTALLSDSRAPKYERDYPNGPDCDEGCTQGGYALSFED